MLPDTEVGAWIKPWLHCGGHDMFVLRSVCSEVDYHFLWCYEQVEYEKDFLMVVWRFDEQPLPKIVPSLVDLCCPFSHPCFAEHLDYLARDCDLSFVCVVMRGESSLAGTMSSCSPFHCRIG